MPSEPLRPPEIRFQLAQASEELRRQTFGDKTCLVVELLKKYPELSAHDDCVLELIHLERQLRREQGQSLPLEVWNNLFPNFPNLLRQETATLSVNDSPPPEGRTLPDLSSPRIDPSVGTHFAGHHLREVLGRGGMGIVFRAWHPTLHREVALKTIPYFVLASSDDLGRFEREARAVACLDHPNIVRLLACGHERGCPYFTMPIIKGSTLENRKSQLVNKYRESVELVEKVARALQHAHEKGIIHRDLKPRNILIDENGEPLLVDFGVAKLLHEQTELTRPGQALGTLAYMDPAQANGQSVAATAATDVWSLGVILYELLSQNRPFKGSTTDTLRQQISEFTPQPLRNFSPGVDATLEAIVMHCLEKKPLERYSSALALAEDLRSWLEKKPTHVYPPGPIGNVIIAIKKRRQLITVGLAFLLLFLVILLIWRLPTQEKRLAEAQACVARGAPATLVAERGPPIWSKSLVVSPEIVDSTPFEGAFTFGRNATSMLMIFPDTGCEYYRLKAQVFHRAGGVGSRVGLAFLLRSAPKNGISSHAGAVFAFNDVDDPQFLAKTPHPATLQLRYYEGPVERYVTSPLRNCPVEQNRGSWHEMVLEVDPERVLCIFDNKQLLPIPWEDLHRAANRLEAPPELAKGLGPRGGIALYSYGGIGSFRNVVVEPLPFP